MVKEFLVMEVINWWMTDLLMIVALVNVGNMARGGGGRLWMAKWTFKEGSIFENNTGLARVNVMRSRGNQLGVEHVTFSVFYLIEVFLFPIHFAENPT